MCWANTWVGKQTGSRMWPQEALVFEMVNTHMDIGTHADTHRKKVQKKRANEGSRCKGDLYLFRSNAGNFTHL